MTSDLDLSKKTKTKNVVQKKNFFLKEKIKLNSSSKIKNKTFIKKSSINSIKNDKNIVFANNNIIIKDITKNYNNINSYLHKSLFNEKIKKSKMNKPKTGDISSDLINFEYNRINKKVKESNIMNNTISGFKLNNSNYISKKNKKKFKSSLDSSDIEPIEKMKVTNNFIKNRKNNYRYGDSYEFNFTFNNYNSNYTENNFNESEIKSSNKKIEKSTLENSINKEIINDFTSVKNTILKDIKDIINNKKNEKDIKNENLKQNKKTEKIGVIRKNKKKNKDKSIYAVKIQKIFRGYIFRKKNKLINKKNSKEQINSNNRVYIKKKILNKKNRLNIAINDNLSYFRKEYYFTETNLSKSKIKENDINNITHGNKIEEIIIDKNKLFSVLGPSSKRKDFHEIKINTGNKFGI